MALDIDKVEAILRQHWQIPSELSRAKLQEHAGSNPRFGPSKILS